MNQPPLNPDAERQCVELLLEYHGTPMRRLYEYPHRDNDSDRYIADAKSLLKKILAVAQPEVNSVEELDQLPLGTTVLGADRISYQMLGQSSIMGAEWWASGSEHRGIEVELPARVLYRPEVKP